MPITDKLQWRTSTRSQTSNCVEVAPLRGAVAVRDSKDAGGPVLIFGRATWREFLAAVRAGRFDA
jgi:Domain of unknown function (DUF397)